MGSILIISADLRLSEPAEAITAQNGLRFKSVSSVKAGLSWLEMREFDGIIIDSRISLKEQEKVADALWRKNIGAPFFVIEKSASTVHEKNKARLMGAELIDCQENFNNLDEKLKNLPTFDISSDTKNFKILVVEDLDSPRDIILTYLEGIGFPNVEGANSGAEALNLLLSNPLKFSCLLTDIRMPLMTGEELIKSIRRESSLRHIPIVVLTAYGTADCLIDCLKAGASGFLVKPPKKKDLVRELSRAFRISRSKQNPRLASFEDVESLEWVLLGN